MNILVIGSGGREHAMCWRLKKSPSVNELYCAPGNPGIETVAKCIDIAVDDIQGLLQFAKEQNIDLTVVGPEYPLTLGVADTFRANGLRIFGPNKDAAQIEGSKSFAKKVMQDAGVPTARYTVLTTQKEATDYLKKYGAPIVLKADGLASGKGVHVCMTEDAARKAINALFPDPSEEYRVVCEEYLEGVEISYIIATDGENIVPMAPSHDYKRIFDNDEGPNTGGMGSVCPTPRFTEADEEFVIYNVMVPTIAQMKKQGTPFSGFLYAGLMKGPDGRINVIEFNARLGDPETQSIMRRLESDFAQILNMLSAPPGQTKHIESLPRVKWSKEVAVCLVAASDGYPDSPKAGDEITGLELTESIPNAIVFHAGTKRNGSKLVTAGGRVLGITGIGGDLETARREAYKAADLIQYRGRQLRRDVGLS